MSIVGYSGLPGSGKSYGVVENVILPALESKRHIITNIPLKLGRLSDDFPGAKVTIFDNKQAEDDPDFFSLDRHPSGVIWIIDEAWRFWKNGSKSVNMPQCQKEFFTEHRHAVGDDGRTNEIVLVTQDLSQLAMFVRQLIEETYRAVKLTAIGQNKKYRVDVYMGAATGQKPGKPMRQLYGSYKPEIYQYYKSHTRNKTDFAAGMEEKADDRANILKHPLIKIGIPAVLVIASWGIYNVYSYFDVGEPESNQSLPSESSSGSSIAPRTNSPGNYQRTSLPARAMDQSNFEIEPGWLPLSDQWRIVGEVNGVYWVWGETGTRKIHSRNCSRFIKTGEAYCVIQGSLVTYYSFREPVREIERSAGTEVMAANKTGSGA
ncbi:zonular occludens toxin domain-containing protein [Marinobacter salexigens]|uniref:zonular occludens toxin domain-containing protein n=1 Tax=Marinobacter salexigens TaxID=1925763 RepID=UPI000C287934|nr:zonular occludens toxin domain-containing protein [Marinobacter salexigens]